MKPSTAAKIERLIDQIYEPLQRLARVSDQESLIKTIRASVHDPANAEFILKLARESLPFPEIDSLCATDLHSHFGRFQTREQLHQELLSFSEARGKKIQHRFRQIRDEMMRAGQELTNAGKRITKSPGRPSEMPSEEECKLICREMRKAINRGEPAGQVQQRLASMWELSVRSIQRIWARQHELLD